MADRILFTLVSILIGTSIVLIYSLTAYTTIHFGVSEFHFAVRQFGYGMVSITLIWFLSTLNPDKWLSIVGFALLIFSAILIIAMPFLPDSLVSAVGGAKRWIRVFGFSLAPVEFFKVGFIYFLAWSFSRKLGFKHDIALKDEFRRFVPYALVFVGAMFMIAFVQNDLGQVVVLGMTLLFMLMFAGSSFRFFLTILLAALGFFLFFIITLNKLNISIYYSIPYTNLQTFQ